ncbi:MAG TPA: Gfo/Idh/MocA family oxidoreductase [Vicinamibacteria bacterium]|nr:Gfo/Idh/MocA family oxidoreductase [Vicinamibacteria bacterium]
MDKLKTAVIGYGKVAHIHAEALASVAESEFVAVCGRDAGRARAFGEAHGVRPFTSVEEMVGAGVQAVVVATPHPAHASVTTAALRAGAHAIVEKPLASSLEDCDAMIGAARAGGRTLATISQRRLYAPSRRVRDAIDAGKLGRPVLGTVTMLGWRSAEYYGSDPWRGSWDGEGGGVLVNQAPHQIDLLQWFLGDVDELYGAWANLNHPTIEVEDTSVAVIRFRSGALGSIVVSNSQSPGIFGKVWVHGTNGATVGVQTDGGSMFIAGMTSVTEPPVNDVWTVPGEEGSLARWQREDAEFFRGIDATKHYHRLQIQDFLRAVLEGREPLVSGVEGRKTVEIFTAIYRAQRDRRPVKFPLQPETNRADLDGRKSSPRG